MAEPSHELLRGYLEAAVEAVYRESPVHFTAARAGLHGMAAVIRVDDDPPLRVWLAKGPPWTEYRADGEVEVSTSRTALNAFLTGEATIEEAIAGGQLAVRAAVGDLVAALGALNAWLHGALRAPSLPRIYAGYRGATNPQGEAIACRTDQKAANPATTNTGC